ncbi:phage tail sheath family protein [Erwinia persicina]|uniref:Phage tail sheath family protein n=1 Tax=Erwinia persicina TaxID=55211 RepID=A0A4U3EST4_9GAMM|nr:phage tail sheath C-terminal domain-containing protein [Erwinia persicina]MBD8109111.1 phage tail sheath family protein [Erwinia persicina]MBD8170111.1 phage tail sheath family protein [Erwinia persicina]MBD8212235.1 phage tail sheath family protein [Erwinia persicina]TKJ83631.1 phage tail sheath family protein [Erwinia persicina]
MSTTVTVPGVYIEEDASPAISVSQGATAVPLFIARFKPKDSKYNGVVTRVSSWLDFSQKFDSDSALSGSVKITSKADNEDTPTKYTYSIASGTVSLSAASPLKLYFQNGGGACYVCALDDASDSATLAALPGLADEKGDITLFVVPENDSDYQTVVYGALTASLDQTKGYFLLADSQDGTAPAGLGSSSHIGVYYPSVTLSSSLTLEDKNVAISGYTNIDAKKTASTLADLLAIDGTTANQVSSALAGPLTAALNVGPSALMAGVYCKVDRERGVWKAPANVVLSGVSDVSVRVTDDAQGTMNQAGVNVIRYFSDRGLVVWGARTQQDDDNWRYIPVRRLFDAAERDIKKAMRTMVFEPNNQLTWKRVQTAIENYLHGIWQQGGLSGNKAAEAYFVQIGKDLTMTTDDINQGKMIVQVGMAAVRPAEFIILQFTQDMAQ